MYDNILNFIQVLRVGKEAVSDSLRIVIVLLGLFEFSLLDVFFGEPNVVSGNVQKTLVGRVVAGWRLRRVLDDV